MRYFTKILAVFGYFLIAVTVLLLLQINSIAMGATEALFPGWGRTAYVVLALCELAAICWLFLSWFVRPSKLVMRKNPTDEDRRAFAEELARRLAGNRFVLEAGLCQEQPDFLPKALELLEAKADAEIRSGAKKVFLGTALSQNGRLDALIVFFSLCRLTWRISCIYNQRPTAREILSVYSTVSSATFISFSIDTLDIPQTITNAMNELLPAVAPAMAASTMPFVGNTLQKFTSAVIDGAANCLLAVRAGVVTKHSFRFAALGENEAQRQSVVRETGSMLLEISRETVGMIVSALSSQLLGLSVPVGKKLRETAGSAAGAAAEKTKNAAESVAKATAGVAEAVGAGTGAVIGAVTDCAGAAGNAVVRGGAAVAGGVRDGVTGLGRASLHALSTTGKQTWSLVNKTGEGTAAILSGSGRALLNLIPHGEKDPMQDAVFALRLALLWAKGFLSVSERAALQEEKKVISSDGLERFICERPELIDLEPWLAPLKVKESMVLEVLALTPVRADAPAARAYLEKLDAFLELNGKLSDRL